MFPAILELTLVHIPVGILELSNSLNLVIFELAFIGSSWLMGVPSKHAVSVSIFHIIEPVSFVNSPVLVVVRSFSTFIVVFEVTHIFLTISECQAPFSIFKVVLPLALIPVASFVRLDPVSLALSVLPLSFIL